MSYGREQWVARFEELSEQLEMGDIGEVEFTELAMDLGLDLKEIAEALERVRADSLLDEEI